MPEQKPAEEEVDGVGRDGDFGMKLHYNMKRSGFDILDCQLVQPMLWRQEDKQLFLAGHIAFKKTALSQGMSEQTWQEKFQELERCIQDEGQILAFYQSCQVAGARR